MGVLLPLLLLPLFLVLILVEGRWRKRTGRPIPIGAAAASIGIYAGSILLSFVFPPIPDSVNAFVEAHRQREFSMGAWWHWVALYVGIEFFYYWRHRASHAIRWLWATHAVHHSVEDVNLTASARLSWTGVLSLFWVFHLPLLLVGFKLRYVLVMEGVNQIYQFFIHTEAVGHLGALEWLFNTPSHHRVHHAVNARYINRNYGGTLIVWDRMFGTFAAENDAEPCIYGLMTPVRSDNPVTLAFHEWERMARELVAAPFRAWPALLLGPPGGTLAAAATPAASVGLPPAVRIETERR